MEKMRGKSSLRSGSARSAAALILACALLWLAEAQSAEPSMDLARKARAANASGAPLVVMFTQPDCPFCERAKRDYLDPVAAPGRSDRLHLVEIDITSRERLTDFDGRLTTHLDFARAHRARLTPTLVFLDARGATLTDPLIGLSVPDLYQGMLERRLEQARSALRGAAR